MECPTTSSLRWRSVDELKSTGFGIIDSTLREGEQFANAFFSTDDKIEIAKLLNAFGVEYIELTSPCASPQSRSDCQRIAELGLDSKILTHVRCTMADARVAVATGVDGVDVVIGTSSLLREFGHGKSVQQIIDAAQEVVSWLCDQGVEVRFSTEDSLRSNLVDLLQVYRSIDALGVDRVGIADTVGIGSPEQIHSLVSTVASVVSADIEFSWSQRYRMRRGECLRCDLWRCTLCRYNGPWNWRAKRDHPVGRIYFANVCIGSRIGRPIRIAIASSA